MSIGFSNFFISIHAPRVGSDLDRDDLLTPVTVISIHAPRVGSDHPAGGIIGLGRRVFQSTLPVWGATTRHIRLSIGFSFQSTLPVWGATFFQPTRFSKDPQFQSTLPVWGATWICAVVHLMEPFQSTLPVWGATGNDWKNPGPSLISIHAPRVGSDRSGRPRLRLDCHFNPRSPCGERPQPET